MEGLTPLPFVGMDLQTDPISLEQALHLFRRTSFGASETILQAVLGNSANDVVEDLIQEALNLPADPDPTWALIYDQSGSERYQQQRELKFGFLRNCYQKGLNEKMTHFWYDHFGTNYRNHNRPPFTHKALQLYRAIGMGDFFDLLYNVGVQPDMLRFLNGYQNQKSSPNENYGRELLELFTMSQHDLDGVSNYSEQDIVQLSRALTGWQIDNDIIEGFFNSARWDNAEDIDIFGEVGSHTHSSVIARIKAVKGVQTAQYICSKLYKYFVYEEINRQVVDDLVLTFIQSNYNITAVLQRLLKSQHFFQAAAIGVRVKDPADLYITALKEVDMTIADSVYNEGTFKRLEYACRITGFTPLENPSVAGYGDHQYWIAVATYGYRYDFAEKVLLGRYGDIPEQDLSAWASTVANFSTNPSVIVAELSKRIFSRPLSEEASLILEDAFKGSVPDIEFENGMWSWAYPEVNEQVNNFLVEAYRFPEYHLI